VRLFLGQQQLLLGQSVFTLSSLMKPGPVYPSISRDSCVVYAREDTAPIHQVGDQLNHARLPRLRHSEV
jgi:hypothetical protein